MNFLYKEKQKISLWWKGISKKEIIVFTFSAITYCIPSGVLDISHLHCGLQSSLTALHMQ